MRWDAWFQAQDEPPIPAQIRPSLNTNLKAATTAYDYCTHQQPGGAFGHHNPCPGGHRQGSAVRRQDGGSPGLLRRRGFGLRDQSRLEPRLCGCRLGMGRLAIQQRISACPDGRGAPRPGAGPRAPPCPVSAKNSSARLGLSDVKGGQRSGAAGPGIRLRNIVTPSCRAAARSGGLRAGIDGRGPGRGRDRRSGPGGVDG